MEALTPKPTACVPKPYTKKELRLLYGIPLSTFKRWLKSVPETAESGRKNWLTLPQVEALFKKYGVPGLKVIEFETPVKFNKVQ
jgi:hypothetical protein